MARLNRSFAVVVTSSLIALLSVTLPALYFGVGLVIRKSHEDLFVQHARTFARVIADEFELGEALESGTRTADLLDLAIIHGEARFAEILVDGRVIRSQLGSPGIDAARRTDLGYTHRGDSLYFIVLPVLRPSRSVELRIGFDERPTEERIDLALNRMLWMLAAYAGVTIGIAIFLGNRLSRPIRGLQYASRAIALGDYAKALQVESGVRELNDLATDLDAMRRELVGVNIRLQEQIREKELAEVRRDLLEKQLRHSQRLETVGTLAGGIAHEFNNVLVPIILFTETALQDLPEGSLSHSDLQRVLASARRARNIVQKILTFSHVLGDTALEPTDLRSVVTESLGLFAALAPPSIDIRTEIVEPLPPVRADATLGVDLLLNLCTNSMQAMTGTPGVLTVGLRLAGPPPGYDDQPPTVELSVSDTGHGMDQATIERIFEPFFTTRAIGQGTGLGLAVVHGIVESFGATMKVESTPGTGTTFRIFFAVAEPAATAAVDG